MRALFPIESSRVDNAARAQRLSLVDTLLYNPAWKASMDFVEVIEQAKALLQNKGRVTYRVLKRQFALDDESLEDLKEQLIEAEELAIDKDGKMLVIKKKLLFKRGR